MQTRAISTTVTTRALGTIFTRCTSSTTWTLVSFFSMITLLTFVANIPGQTQTLPSAIYAFLQVPGGEPAALRLVGLSLVVAMGAVLLSDWLGKRVAERIRGT